MAAILDAMGPYVMQLIADMATEEVKMLLGISGDIEKLENNMESIKCFLVDAERKRITEVRVQRWVQKLKNAMYDATDILDLCQIEADKQRESKGSSTVEKAPGCCRPLLSCLLNPVFAHKIGSRIKELNQRLDNIYEEAHKFNFINLGSHPEQRMSTGEKVTSEFVESAIVGEKIEKETRELAQMLTINGHHDIKVVAIVGTGGMGKTTLAQKIFNETTVQEQFKVKIWLSITQHFDDVELLRTAIEHAGGVHGGLQDKTLLSRRLTNTLSMGRFLLVLDDVWNNVAWSNVLSVPVRNASKNQQGNWVLFTTRLEDLAQKTGASFYQHHVSPLNKDDAWSLLNKQLPPTPGQVHGTDHLKVVGMKIISKCGGLPLAIKVMGGLLSTKPRSEGDWEAVLKHHAWSVAGLPKELDNAIYLSYEDLSPQLKQCFLYCSLFPKGTTIWQREVVPMWISEGFIHPPDRSSSSYDDWLEERAEGYYQDLMTRNLIEPTEKSTLTRCSCTMHDVVRSFAEFMSKEESLVVQDQQDDGGSKMSDVRHLSIGSTKSALEWDILQKHKSVRTLIINKRINVQPTDSFGRLSTLRVLFIRGTDCDRLVDSLCQLRHLRYLHLDDTNITRLPGDIHRMKFLQHIVVDRCPQLDHLPSCITQLPHLRTLSMYGSHDNVLIPKGFGQLKNLRTLYGFRVHLDKNGGTGWCSLEEIGPLSQLRKLSLHGLENVPASSSAGMAMVSSKEHLDYLGLHWSSTGFMGLRDETNKQQQRALEEVIEKLSPPSSIRHLYIKGYFGSRLPNWMMVPATCGFKSLRIFRMDKLHYCTQLPDGLCQLPSLESLSVNDTPAIKSVGPEFQSPSSLAVGGGIVTPGSVVGFPNLATLRLAGLCKWEEWVWEEQGEDVTVDAMAMPALNGLSIANCKLSCLPPGLASSRRHALREVRLYKLSNLTYIENFPSVVQLGVFDCPKLRRISDISKLQKIWISHCRNLQVLKGVPSLDSMEMRDGTMETVPEYVTTVRPRYLKLTCSKELYESLLTGSSSEYDKISHIKSCTIDYFRRR